MIYRNVYREGRTYSVGDAVTWAGSLWHCMAETDAKPGEGNTSWQLAVKRGANGRDGKNGERGMMGPEGRPGKDAPQY